MNIYPKRETFISEYSTETPQVVWSRILVDLDTPVSCSLKLMEENEFFFLLESVESGESRGRYSILGMDPQLIWKWEGDHSYISEDSGKTFKQKDLAPLDCLRKLIDDSQFTIPKELPPMASSLIGYLSYDAIHNIEPVVANNKPDSIGIPKAIYTRPRTLLVFDNVYGHMYLIYTLWPPEKSNAEDDYKRATDKLEELNQQLRKQALHHEYPSSSEAPSDLHFESNLDKTEFEDVVKRCKDYIHAGDIFQVVPSRRFKSPFKQSAFSFYRSLRQLNPSPFLFYLNFGDFQLIGSSPEIMVRVADNKVTIRPLAGTRKRGKDLEEDNRLAADLLADEKELSEHLMLLDLSRHDVGRVSKAGTVKVTEQMVIEYYSHVMHISSNVEGDLDTSKDALDALLSGLPLGTVSGAPKIRAMQIINELEPETRSFYAGSVGYFSANGQMETCVTLRTALIKDETLYVQAGCGIVANSQPDLEYEETENKARAIIAAAEHTSVFPS